MFTEWPMGPAPLWLWLNESGLPLPPSSWEGVFRTASARCAEVLSPVMAAPPFCTPHMARHSFALCMLVVLHHVMDRRMGLTEQERRDFRTLYGDPWRMVQDLLGHAQLETARSIYLNPRELHQTGRKSQVARSGQCPAMTPSSCNLAV
ncbi:hypothetical protein [Streptomyces sp. NRRL S-4]|uniref:hypothetical protein n=1 Tax=Streptomyces sp. NRRL S-4 TaxID=1519471 RepID=UPI00131D2D77|nr:hypothetical protein [Streptomyces sp. NRRL S-4]